MSFKNLLPKCSVDLLVCVGKSLGKPPVMFRMNGIPTIARGEGVGMTGARPFSPPPIPEESKPRDSRQNFF